MTLFQYIIAAIAALFAIHAAATAWAACPTFRQAIEAARRRTRRALVSFERPRLPDSRLRKLNQVQS